MNNQNPPTQRAINAQQIAESAAERHRKQFVEPKQPTAGELGEQVLEERAKDLERAAQYRAYSAFRSCFFDCA